MVKGQTYPNLSNGNIILDSLMDESLFIYPKSELPYTDIITSKSLLRYPGGKSRAVEIISQLIPSQVKEICSPFFGGGSIELFCAAKGVKVFGYDIFTPLVEFWQCVQEDANRLADEVSTYFPLPKGLFYELQSKQTDFIEKFQRAAVFYVLNRSSFSGSTLSGGMSPEHPRFTPSSIQRLRDFNNKNFTVCQLDFDQSIATHQDAFLYLDPPYLIKNTLYGKNGNTHRDFNHEGLAKVLSMREKWILSYNDCPEIRKLYEGYKTICPNWKYGMSNDKSSKEVLILSQDVQAINNL